MWNAGRRRAMAVAGLVVLSAILLPTAARADNTPYGGAVKVIKRVWDAAKPDLQQASDAFQSPDLLRKAINTGYAMGRATLEDQIKADLGKPNAVMNNATLYNIICTMGQAGGLTIKPGNPVTMNYDINGNYIEFTSTQPTVAGKWADPRFSVNFDLSVTLTMPVPNLTDPLRVVSATAKIHNSKIDSHGVIADVVMDFANVLKTVGGPNLIGKAENAIDSKAFDFTQKINAALQPINDILNQLKGQSYAMMDGFYDPGAQTMSLVVTRTVGVVTTGPGEVDGTIRWAKALGDVPVRRVGVPKSAGSHARTSTGVPHAPAPFTVRAMMRTGLGDPMSFTGPTQVVGKGTVESPELVGDYYECKYRVTNLPLGIPLSVEVKDAGVTWEGQAASMNRFVSPRNWEGHVVIKPLPHHAAALVRLGDLSLDARAINPQPLPPGPPDPEHHPNARPAGSLGSAHSHTQTLDKSAGSPGARTGTRRTPPADTTPATPSHLRPRTSMVVPQTVNPSGVLKVDYVDFEMTLAAPLH